MSSQADEITWLSRTHLERDLQRARSSSNKHVGISEALGYDSDSIDWLRNCTWINALTIDSARVADLAPIGSLANLAHLAIGNLAVPVDLSSNVGLRSLRCAWRNIMRFPDESAELRTLALTGSQRAAVDLTPLPAWRWLTRLAMDHSGIRTLAGCGRYSTLERIQLYNMNKLTSLADLSRCLELKSISLESCSQLTTVAEVAGMTSIEEVRIRRCPAIRDTHALKDTLPGVKVWMVEVKSPTGLGATSAAKVAAHEGDLPTAKWAQRLAAGDATFTVEAIADSDRALRQFLHRMRASVASARSSRTLVRKLTREFNRINTAHGHFIETLEREELAEWINGVARSLDPGLADGDVTEPWREW